MLYESILLTGMPRNAREQAGEAQEPQDSKPRKHQKLSFFDPQRRHNPYRFSFTFDAHFNNREKFWAWFLIEFQETLPAEAESVNVFINFENSHRNLQICQNCGTGKLAQHCRRITLGHLQESALRVIALCSCAPTWSRKCPEKPRD